MRAVSLRVLQDTAARTPQRAAELRLLCGLTVLAGYVIDVDSKDLILFGQVEAKRPPLHAEDLAVALRNARLKYAERKGNTVTYSHPGCSIDPAPAVMHDLQMIGESIQRTEEIEEARFREWERVCGRPQTVKILGIPFATHFSRILVDADYCLKRLVDGSDSLGLDSFSSIPDMTLADAKEQIIRDGKTSIPLESMNRFWLYPGLTRYSEDNGIVEIASCPVILLTEEEHVVKNEIVGTNRTNPYAKKFADSFSAEYEKIAEKRPIYRELEGLFRFVALAKIWDFKHADVDLRYLLDACPLSPAVVPRTLAGLSNLKKIEHRQDVPGGVQVFQLYLPSCGGVDIGINITASDFVHDQTGRLAEIRRSLLDARRSSDSLYWDFSPKAQPGLPPKPASETDKSRSETAYQAIGDEIKAMFEALYARLDEMQEALSSQTAALDAMAKERESRNKEMQELREHLQVMENLVKQTAAKPCLGSKP